MNRIITVMMVEDHPDYRESIELALETEAEINLIGKYGTAERAIRNIIDTPASEMADVILLDLNLPGICGLEALPHILKIAPQSKVIVLTQSGAEVDVLAAISAGASGYLLKKSTLNQITEGIRTVMHGGAALDASVAKYMLKTLRNHIPKDNAEISLTERELEILVLLADGFLKKEIGDKLNISVTTVATHIRHIYEKLGVQNAPAAINKAYNHGIFPVGE